MAASAPTPAILPPPGQQTDYSAPNELAFWNSLTQGLALGITGILWFMRLYVRIWVKRAWILEDYFAVLSFINLVLYSVFTTTIVLKGGGAHQWNVTTTQIQDILFYVNISQIWYGITAATMKTCILMLYIRIFSPTPGSKFNICIKVLIAVIDLFYLGNTFAKIFQCWPRSKIWIPVEQGNCINLPILLSVSGVFNCLSDIVILLVPIKGLWALRISTLQKLGIYAVFTVGIVGPVFSLIGFIQRYQRSGSPDQSYNQLVILLWATAELAAGMMIISLPTIPGIVQKPRRQTTLSIGNSNSHPMSSRSRNSKFALGSRSSRLSDDRHLVGSDYFELIDTKAGLATTDDSTQAAIEKISGAKSEARVQVNHRGLEDIDTPNGRILKTVTVQHSNV